MSVEYKSVNRSWQHFGDIAKEEESKIKKYPSIFLLYDSISQKIYAEALKLIEKLIGTRLYSSVEEEPWSGFAPRTKIIALNLIKKKIIKRITKIPRRYHDEPKIIQYQTETPTSYPDISAYSDGRGSFSKFGGGADLNEERAFMKAVGEGVERLCLCTYKEKDCLLSTYKEISKKAVNPLSFAGISELQRQSINGLKIDERSVFRWVQGRSLIDGKKFFIPAQSVYIGYKYCQGEPMIQQQISTGAAAADSFEEALYKGICEAVERDAFMITYLNKLSPPVIDLEAIDDPKIQETLAAFKRYKLELYVVDTTTDIGIPTMTAVIIDRTEAGLAVHVGCKTSLNIREAITGVVWETLRGRIGSRGSLSSLASREEKKAALKSDPLKISSFADRRLFWDGLDMIPKIGFLFNGQKKRISQEELDNRKDISNAEKLETVVKILQRKNIDIYGFDITMPEIKGEGIWVAKVVSPQLQPLYLMERTRHVSGQRLFNVPVAAGYYQKPLSESELNPLPHPFL